MSFRELMLTFLRQRLEAVEQIYNLGGEAFCDRALSYLENPGAMTNALSSVRVRPACCWPYISNNHHEKEVTVQLHGSGVWPGVPLIIRCGDLVVAALFNSERGGEWILYNVSHLGGTPVPLSKGEYAPRRSAIPKCNGMWNLDDMTMYDDEIVLQNCMGAFEDFLPKQKTKKKHRPTVYANFERNNNESVVAILKFLFEISIAGVCFEV